MKYLIGIRESVEVDIEKKYPITKISYVEYNSCKKDFVSFKPSVVTYLLSMKVIYGTRVEIGERVISGSAKLGVKSMYVVDDYSMIENSEDKIVIYYLSDDYYIVRDIERRDGRRYYKCDNVVGLLFLLSKLYRVYSEDILKNIDKLVGL